MSGLRCSTRCSKIRLLAALAAGLVAAGFGPAAAVAAPTTMVDLGSASTYAVISGASVGNTVNADGAPRTTLRGDLGVKSAAVPTGFPPGVVTGTTRIGTPAAAQAHADLVTAYENVAARTGGVTRAGALAGATITPGLYTIVGAASNTGTVTLDGGGDPNAVFVFQIGGAMSLAAGSHVVLTNGAQASRVFWQVNGAGAVGAGGDFAGTLMAMDAVAMGNGTMVNGRAFARNGALTLDANEFYSAPPVVTLDGGATVHTADTTPTISGTTDVEAPGIVTVTIAGQTLTATPAGGAWSVDAAILANGTYAVVASVRDGAHNTGSATQQLTVDTVLPVVAFDAGPSAITNDPTPTITGTSDVATGTTVRVTAGAQSRTALVQSDATWSVTLSALADGTRTVTASVSDPAGNEGTASQELTVDTTPPAVAIAGGADALTNDPTPQIAGTADVAAGTTVTVTLPDETLTALVRSGGTWSVTAATTLPDGPHRVVVSVSDEAGNPASFTQRLTVDTVAPIVTITGGATATTSDVTPTIAGTSDAAPGTTVTVSIAGQTMTTLVQADGTWNATPSAIGTGTWTVVASAPDPAGNVGSAGQELTIATATPPGAGGGEPTPAPVAPFPAPTPTPSPAPAPAPAPAPGGPGATSTAAATTVAPGAVQQVKHAKTLSIGTKVTAPAARRVVASVSGTVRIKGAKRAIKLTSVTRTIAAGKSTTLTLRPKGSKKVAAAALARIKSAVKAGKKVTATITVKIVDAGTTRTTKRTVTLK